MKELLKNLTREELQELGQKYIKDYSTRLNNPALINRLSNTQIDADDLTWIQQANRDREMDKLVEEEKTKEVKKVDVTTRYIDQETGRPLTSIELEQRAKVQGEQLLRELTANARKEANKTVIAYVTPASKEDINLQKTCESFITGNAYFTISVVVPFGVYVEIPKAIAQIIREAICPQVIELNDFQRSKIPGKPIAALQNTRRYNIQTWSKEDFERNQSAVN